MRRIRCILPDEWYEGKNAVFACSKLAKFPTSINSFCQWYYFWFKLNISVCLKFQKTKSYPLVLIKFCLPVTSINLISFIRVLIPFFTLSWIMEFFWDVWFCLCFVAFTVIISLVFISGQNFIPTSKDVAATTAVVELIMRTVTVLMLLTLKIVYYSRNLPVQQIFKELFSVQHWKISANGHGFVWIGG